MSEVDRALMALRLEVDGGIVDTIKAIVDKEIAGLRAENERLTRELAQRERTGKSLIEEWRDILGADSSEATSDAARRVVAENAEWRAACAGLKRMSDDALKRVVAERDLALSDWDKSRRDLAEARAEVANLKTWRGDGDEPLPEDAAIEAAFPTRSGRHDLYAEAMRLVGARRSKAGLVALVTWLLLRCEGKEAPWP